QEPMF
ncbi:hypothetical protein CP8484711_1282, partial [Chlamydia psittaci 84-8471/1]